MTSRRRSAATQNEGADFIRLGASIGAQTVAQQAQAVAAYREQRLQNEGMLTKLRLEQANKDREALFTNKRDILKSNLTAMEEVMKNPENYDTQTFDAMRQDYQNTLAAMDNLTRMYSSGESIADAPVIASTFNYPISAERRSSKTAENTILQNRAAEGDLDIMSANNAFVKSGGLFSDPSDYALNNYRQERLGQFDEKLNLDTAYKQYMMGNGAGGTGAGKYAQGYRKYSYLAGQPDAIPSELLQTKAGVAAMYPEIVQMAAEQNPAFGEIIQNRIPGLKFDPSVRGFDANKQALDNFLQQGESGGYDSVYPMLTRNPLEPDVSPYLETVRQFRSTLYPD